MVKKEFEMEIDGKTVGFRFNMLASGKACKILNCSMDELFVKLGLIKGSTMDLESALYFFFAAAQNYSESKGQPIDYSAQDVSDWLDHYGLEKSMKMIMEAFNAPEIKNQTAPKESGPESILTT